MKKELFFLLIFSHFIAQNMEKEKFITIPFISDQPHKKICLPKCLPPDKWQEHFENFSAFDILHVTTKELALLPALVSQYFGLFTKQPLKAPFPSGKNPTKSYVQDLFFIASQAEKTTDSSSRKTLKQFLQSKSDQDILGYQKDLDYLNVSDTCKNALMEACHTRYRSLQKKLKNKNLSENEKQTIEIFCEYIKTSYMNTVQITEDIADYGDLKFLLKNTDGTHIGTIDKTPVGGAILLQSSHIKYPEHIQFILDRLNTKKWLPKKNPYIALFDTRISITLYNTNLKSLCLDTFFKYLPYISHITFKNHEQVTITNQDLRTYAKHAINITFDNCTFKKSVGPFYTQHFYRMRRTPIITFKGKFTEEEKNSIIKNTKVPWYKKIVPLAIIGAYVLFENIHIMWLCKKCANDIISPIWWENAFLKKALPAVKNVDSDSLKIACNTLLSDLSNEQSNTLRNLWQINNALPSSVLSNSINLLLSSHASSVAKTSVPLLDIVARLLLAKTETNNAWSELNDTCVLSYIFTLALCGINFYVASNIHQWIKPKCARVSIVESKNQKINSYCNGYE